MAETNLIPTETPSRPSPTLPTGNESLHLTGEIEEEGVFTSLISSFRDVFFPVKLPPLVLESTPIAVPDLMATQMSKKSIAMSITFYALLILLIAFIIAHKVKEVIAPKSNVVLSDVVTPPPPIKPAVQQIGGGGGAHDVAPVSRGHLPKFEKEPLLPPKAPPTDTPKLTVPPAVNVQTDLKMANNNMPNIGMPNSGLHGVSLGTGDGGGLGNGHGNGLGNGSGGNTGGGVMHIGGGVSPPVPIYTPDPEFSEEARKAKFSGNVEVYLWVDEQGHPSHVQVIRPIGMGLDEKAIEAVKQYKFKPAMKNGKPVKVDLYIDVNFQIF